MQYDYNIFKLWSSRSLIYCQRTCNVVCRCWQFFWKLQFSCLYTSLEICWIIKKIFCLFLPTVQLSSRCILCTQKSPFVLHPVAQKLPQCCLWNSTNYKYSGPLSSFWGRSLALPHTTPLLQMIKGVVSLALCPQVVSRVPQHLAPRSKPLVRAALPSSVSAQPFPFTLACPGQYTRRSFWRWMLTIGTFQSGLPIPLFFFL